MKGSPVFGRNWRLYPATKNQGQKPLARRGQGIVEFALGMPFMLLILLGTIDLGQMFFEYIDLRSGVREGVAAAARAECPAANALAQAAILKHSEVLADGTTVIDSLEYSPSCPTDVYQSGTVTLTASRQYHPVFSQFLDTYFGLGGAINMEASASAKVWT